jgi:aminoglycoside 2'-N-acetyltransferase I
MSSVRTAHTADLGPATLRELRALLDEVFADEMTDEDWDHSIGGMHAIALDDDGAIVGHGSVVQRRLLHGDRALRTGYVEGVAVRAEARRRGHGAAIMTELERIIRGAYELGALGASDEGAPLYTSRGWRRWDGPTYALSPDGVVRTADDDGDVYVFPATAELDLTAPITCDWRAGDAW